MALASRCEIVLLSRLCPWLEGDVCCRWRVAGEKLLCAEGKKALRWLKRPGKIILLFHLVIVVVIIRVAVANHVDRQNFFLGSGGERKSKEYKDFKPK